jgi:hypothetical protein
LGAERVRLGGAEAALVELGRLLLAGFLVSVFAIICLSNVAVQQPCFALV